jgi:hypothetical protein
MSDFIISLDSYLLTSVNEWGWTAQIAIAQHAIARHFLQEINCSTQNLKTAWIGLTGFEQMTKKFTTYPILTQPYLT